MRSLKLSHLERALVRKLYARRYTIAVLTRMFRCCQTTVNRAVRNHMEDNLEDDDALIRNAELPADVSVMLGLKECDDDSAPPVPNRSRWRPWVPTRGVMQSRTPASVLQPFPRLAARSPKVSIGHFHHPSRIPRIVINCCFFWNRWRLQKVTTVTQALSYVQSRRYVVPTTLLVYPNAT